MINPSTTLLTFASLKDQLTSPTISHEDALELLNLHKSRLLSVLSSSVPSSLDEKIIYLRHSDCASRFPTPTEAETSCIQSLNKYFAIPTSEAANLIRDYLTETASEPLVSILDTISDLTTLAPLYALKNYWIQERHAALSILLVVLTAAFDPRLRLLHIPSSSFVEQNKNALKNSILSAANHVILSYADAHSNISPKIHARWYMALLFALTFCFPLSIEDRESLLSSYSSIAERKHRYSTLTSGESPRPSVPTFDGGEVSILFVAAMNHASSIRTFTEVFSEIDGSSDASSLMDLESMQRLDILYAKLRCDPSPETALLTLSWASLRQLRANRHCSRTLPEPTEEDVSEIPRHMSFALSCDVFFILQKIATDGISLPSLLVSHVFRCFWDDFVAFFTAFPPRDLLPNQVSQVVALATSLLQSLRDSDVKDIASLLWAAESSKRSFIGANAILRIASSVFPQTYRPLINFLSALTVHEDIAKEVLSYLSERLTFISESSKSYQNALYVLDEEESDILQSICLDRHLDIDILSRTLDMVRVGDEDSVFVQAAENIPADSYRPQILKGSIGVSNISQTIVTWVMPWNGFGAVARILNFLISLFNDQNCATQFDDTVLEELTITATDSLKLIDRLFAEASPEVAQEYLSDVELVRVIAQIVAESADPGDRARSCWLTRARQERLLTASTSSLASVTCIDPARARFALETLEVFKDVFPFSSAVSTLAESAFPAIAAIARIAFVSSCSDMMSLKLRGALASQSPHSNGRWAASQWLGKDTSPVTHFLIGNVLPLWLTYSAGNGKHGSGINHLFWVLPACSLQLFSADSALILQSPIVSSLFSAVVLAACDEDKRNYSDADAQLFPALRAALIACYIALRERNRVLQEKSEFDQSGGRKLDTAMHPDHVLGETSTFENTLMKPDIVRAMAVLSSGLAAKLKSDHFFETPTSSLFAGFLTKPDHDTLWTYCPDYKDRAADSAAYWRTWIAGVSARCLALQFCCLSQMSQAGDIIQVAWPTTPKAPIGHWEGIGESIRKAFAKLIDDERSVPHIELVVTVLACGQRAAARSLLAPVSALVVVDRLRKLNGSAFSLGAQKAITYKSNNNDSDQHSESDSEVMCAVVSCLRHSQQQWIQKASNTNIDQQKNDLSEYIELGQTCLKIVACVRFLRVAWESQNSKWFETCWRRLNVWNVMADLVRCKGSNAQQSDSVDFAQAIDFPKISVASPERLGSIASEGWSDLYSITQDIVVAIDVSACWKAIAADVLQMFSAEISYKTTAYLKSPEAEEKGNNKDDGKDTLPVEFFTEGTFAVFQSVFTERWMHVLFKVNDHPDESFSIKRRVSRRNLQDSADKDIEKQCSVEERSQEISTSFSNLIFPRHELKTNDILRVFDRAGDVTTRFGADYCYDIARILHVLQVAGRSVEEAKSLLPKVASLNMDMTLQDVQAEIVRAFSAMSSAVVFADSFCPQSASMLSYSSPQFGGKVCRFLSRYLLFISPRLRCSGHAVGITSEISMLTASLSSRLSADELDQAALTSVRFQSLILPDDLGSLNVVGQLCVVIDDLMESIDRTSLEKKVSLEKLEIIRWLLLTASKLAQGAAFRNRSDLIALTRCVMKVLQDSGQIPFVSAACSVALSAVLDQRLDGWLASLDSSDVGTLVKTISSLSNGKRNLHDSSCEIAANLLLIIAKGYFTQGSVDSSTRSFVIRQLAGGTVMGMLPPESETIVTYDSNAESRNASHVLWCSSLRLASVAISDAAESRKHGGQDKNRDVLEFGCAAIGRIGRDSLNLSGDWPSCLSALDANESKCITIAKVEEAELSALVLFRLSGYAFQLRNVLPEGLRNAVAELIRFTDHALRLLRAEPVERWVRPITRRERERSYLLRRDRDTHGNLIFSSSSPPWSGSPSRSQTPGSPTPAKRSPMQALRAAIGDSSGRGSPVPPSPGFTPMSPSTGMPGSGQMSSSPLSPWIPYGAGLISETGLYFGEEVSRCLLRGLSSALSALRRFAFELDVALFSTSLVSFDDPPGLGSLMNILHHAGGELQRGTEDMRRNMLLTIAENAFILMVFHVRLFMEQDVLSQHVKDELRKRIPTYIMRMRRSVPPPPSTSVLAAVEIDPLWEQLR